MGSAKAQMLRQHELETRAVDVLVEAGAAHRCPHGTAIWNHDPEAMDRAYAYGATRVKDGTVDAS